MDTATDTQSMSPKSGASAGLATADPVPLVIAAVVQDTDLSATCVTQTRKCQLTMRPLIFLKCRTASFECARTIAFAV